MIYINAPYPVHVEIFFDKLTLAQLDWLPNWAKDTALNIMNYISEDFILKKIKERLTAKQEGNYKLADQIRDELLKKGVIIEDQKDKTTWKFK